MLEFTTCKIFSAVRLYMHENVFCKCLYHRRQIHDRVFCPPRVPSSCSGSCRCQEWSSGRSIDIPNGSRLRISHGDGRKSSFPGPGSVESTCYMGRDCARISEDPPGSSTRGTTRIHSRSVSIYSFASSMQPFSKSPMSG